MPGALLVRQIERETERVHVVQVAEDLERLSQQERQSDLARQIGDR
jgi:hypothetical protein